MCSLSDSQQVVHRSEIIELVCMRHCLENPQNLERISHFYMGGGGLACLNLRHVIILKYNYCKTRSFQGIVKRLQSEVVYI